MLAACFGAREDTDNARSKMQKAADKNSSVQQTGAVTWVAGKHVFIANTQHTTIYAHRDALSFSDPYIGLEVAFELRIVPDMKNPVADKVANLIAVEPGDFSPFANAQGTDVSLRRSPFRQVIGRCKIWTL